MSLLDNASARTRWLATVSTLIVTIQLLEQDLSRAMADTPTHRQMEHIASADGLLGVAAKALSGAAASVRKL